MGVSGKGEGNVKDDSKISCMNSWVNCGNSYQDSGGICSWTHSPHGNLTPMGAGE